MSSERDRFRAEVEARGGKMKQGADFGDFISIGFAILAVGGIAFFIISSVVQTIDTKPLANSREESYKILIARWLETSNKSLNETRRKEVAECVYNQDPNILAYREQLKDQQDERNEGHMINSVDPLLKIDFLKSLDEYTSGNSDNGYKGRLLTEEKSRIEKAIQLCLKK